MHNLLIWPLSQDDKIIFSSQGASLSSIICSDLIDISLCSNTQEYVLVSGLTGCKLSSFRKTLNLLLQAQQNKVELDNIFTIKSSETGMILIEIYKNDCVLKFNIITLDDIKSWVFQLELLEVVMQENENEQKNRHNGCCG